MYIRLRVWQRATQKALNKAKYTEQHGERALIRLSRCELLSNLSEYTCTFVIHKAKLSRFCSRRAKLENSHSESSQVAAHETVKAKEL